MQGAIKRLRAALTPQALLLLAAALLLLAAFPLRRESASIEARAGRVLSQIEGAGRVEVAVMTRKKQEAGGALGMRAQPEEVPCGAVAVAQGADDPFVRMQLTQALCSLLGLPASAVSVVTGGGSR